MPVVKPLPWGRSFPAYRISDGERIGSALLAAARLIALNNVQGLRLTDEDRQTVMEMFGDNDPPAIREAPEDRLDAINEPRPQHVDWDESELFS